jgi:hypothetical protein
VLTTCSSQWYCWTRPRPPRQHHRYTLQTAPSASVSEQRTSTSPPPPTSLSRRPPLALKLSMGTSAVPVAHTSGWKASIPSAEKRCLPSARSTLGIVDVTQEGVDLSKTELKYFDVLHDVDDRSADIEWTRRVYGLEDSNMLASWMVSEGLRFRWMARIRWLLVGD